MANIPNLGNMMAVMSAWNTFKSNHPKFPNFLKAVQKKGIPADSIIEIAITTPDGEKIETNLKIQQSDLDLINNLKSMS